MAIPKSTHVLRSSDEMERNALTTLLNPGPGNFRFSDQSFCIRTGLALVAIGTNSSPTPRNLKRSTASVGHAGVYQNWAGVAQCASMSPKSAETGQELNAWSSL
jgi:hypothetical protein